MEFSNQALEIYRLIDYGQHREIIQQIAHSEQSATIASPVLNYLKYKKMLAEGQYQQCIQQTSDATQPELMEILADAHLQRFSYAPIGHAQRADINDALRIYQQLLSSFPEYENAAWIQYQIGNAFLAINDIHNAVQNFRAGLHRPSRLNTIKAMCYERLGHIAFYEERNFKQALNLLNLAVAVYPQDKATIWLVQTQLLLSRVYTTLNMTDEAYSATKAAIKAAEDISPKDHVLINDTFFAAGELLSKIPKYYDEAANLMVEYTKSRPVATGMDVSWSRANEIIGDIAFKKRHYAQAVNHYNIALHHNPYHPWQTSIYYRIATCYYHIGEYQNVITTVEKIQEIATQDQTIIEDYRLFDILGSAHFALGQYRQAAIAYQQAINYAPSDDDVLDKIKLYHYYSLQLDNNQQGRL